MTTPTEQPRSETSAEPPRLQTPTEGRGEAPRVQIVEAAALTGDPLGALLEGRLGALLIADAFDPTALTGLVDWLKAHPGPAGPHDSAPFPGQTWGDLLVLAPADRSRYHQRALLLRDLLATGPLPLADHFIDLLTRAGAGETVHTPHDPTDRPYTTLTIRRLPATQSVGIHSERSDWPAMADLQQRLAGPGQLSCYAPLLLGDDGGQLELYHRPPAGEQPDLGGKPDHQVHPQLATFGLTVLRPRVGDLLVFDGGRFNHRVPAASQGERWTAGGFLARAASGERWMWS